MSFSLWVMLGALGVFIADAARLTPVQKAWLVAIPILGGSALRLPVGRLADRVGAKRVGLVLLAWLFLPLAMAWLGPARLPWMVVVGLALGAGGASFAVALPLASRWYPPQRQGLAMGIAAAGNSGTVITNLLAPRLAAHVGWQGVFGLAMIPLALVLAGFALLARESPGPLRRPARGSGLHREPDAWAFCLFYAVTFGGYVGLGSFLPLFLHDQYRLAPAAAGTVTALAALAGSAARPVGGWLADRVGGGRLLLALLLAIAGLYGAASTLPSLPAMQGLLVVAMACLGMGNGAVFQLVPLRFGERIGEATGLVGALGGLGGFLVPMMLGATRQWAGSFGTGFAALGTAAAAAGVLLVALTLFQERWRGLVRGA
ncbi:MAG: MFS transporter [Myxococcales bacterium]